MEDNMLPVINIQGLIVYKRTFGKKLAFLDILCDDNKEIEVILKECHYINTTSVGEYVSVDGKFKTELNKEHFLPINITTLAKRDQCKDLDHTRKVIEKETQKPKENKCLCKMFKKTNLCNLPHCNFRHFLLEGETEKLQTEIKKKEQAFNKVHEGDPLNKETKLKKLQRHRLFSEFIIDYFGLEYLKTGPILDIAGGKGMVSYNLMENHGLDCVIVDPRGVALPKKQQKALRQSNIVIKEIRSYFNENFDETLIEQASLIIGMHPDEATFDIVKTAHKYNKSFAVVPCCVFPSKYPERILSNGDPVIEYTQLLQYIQEYVVDAEIKFLNIEGRNKIICKKV